MAFTREQIEEIRAKLEQFGSIKDTDFPKSAPLNGEEEVVLIQESRNVRTKITEILDTVSRFRGYFISEEDLLKVPPMIGNYAYVGSTLGASNVYIPDNEVKTWVNTGTKATEYLSILVTGAVSIGENGNWFNGTIDSGFPAAGPQGIQGPIGNTGQTGEAGYTPIRGTDYYTEEDVTGLITILETYINTVLNTTNQSLLNIISKV